MSKRGHCILSHGFESGPDATKVTALAGAAQRLGWSHERPDYTDLDAKREASELGDVPARLQRLLALARAAAARGRSEEHTSELQSLMRISYAVFCLKKKNKPEQHTARQTRK